jgi:hypothetical protein
MSLRSQISRGVPNVTLVKPRFPVSASLNASQENRVHVGPLEARFYSITCWLPAIAFVILIGFATIASIRVGHWPYYSNPDPKELHLPLLHAAALFSYPLALISLPIGLLIALLSFDSLRRRDIIVFTTGAAAWAFIFPIVGRLFEWLVD